MGVHLVRCTEKMGTLPSGCFRSVFALAAGEMPQANFLAPAAINSRLSAWISSIMASVTVDGLVTGGPYTETKEHMGGFWILEAADLDEALAWAKKAAIACDVPGEVRELLFYPAPEVAE
jgi:hypothetical protein